MQYVTFSYADEAVLVEMPHTAAVAAVESGQAKFATVHEGSADGRISAGASPDTTYVQDAALAEKFLLDDVYIV